MIMDVLDVPRDVGHLTKHFPRRAREVNQLTVESDPAEPNRWSQTVGRISKCVSHLLRGSELCFCAAPKSATLKPGSNEALILILSKASEANLGGRKKARSAAHNELGGFGGVSPPL